MFLFFKVEIIKQVEETYGHHHTIINHSMPFVNCYIFVITCLSQSVLPSSSSVLSFPTVDDAEVISRTYNGLNIRGIDPKQQSA